METDRASMTAQLVAGLPGQGGGVLGPVLGQCRGRLFEQGLGGGDVQPAAAFVVAEVGRGVGVEFFEQRREGGRHGVRPVAGGGQSGLHGSQCAAGAFVDMGGGGHRRIQAGGRGPQALGGAAGGGDVTTGDGRLEVVASGLDEVVGRLHRPVGGQLWVQGGPSLQRRDRQRH